MTTTWVFDVDGCLVDSLTGTSLRPGAVDLITSLRKGGHQVLLWSAAGAAYARQRAVEQGIDGLVIGCYAKDGRDASGHYLTHRLPVRIENIVFVDDRPEDLPAAARIMAVSPYLSHNPHDRALSRLAPPA